MPYGFKNLQPRKERMTVTRQLVKSRDFRQNYLCDFHLGVQFYSPLFFLLHKYHLSCMDCPPKCLLN
jgi:hypothetical protein